MSFRAKRLIKKIISWSGLFFFALAAYMLYRQLSKYHLQDIQDALMSIPRQNLLYACAASFIGYVALSSYDFLALKYIGRKLAAWKWIFVGFIGFSVSNNAGHAIVSGGAIRYRLYTRWRFHGEDIVKMVTFSGFTYLVACFFLVIMGYVLTPDHAFGEGSVSKMTTTVTALCSAAGLGVYFWASLFYKKPIVIKDIEFDIPSFKMALAQVFIGGSDFFPFFHGRAPVSVSALLRRSAAAYGAVDLYRIGRCDFPAAGRRSGRGVRHGCLHRQYIALRNTRILHHFGLVGLAG